MHATHIVILLAAILALTRASPTNESPPDKRIVLQKGMRPIKTPSGIHILRREGDEYEHEKRYRLLPGMHPVDTPGDAVALKRRFVLEPGMHPIDESPDDPVVALKRYVLKPGMMPLLEPMPGEAVGAVSHKKRSTNDKEAKGPLRLQVEPSTFTGRRPGMAPSQRNEMITEEKRRSMPLEIDSIEGQVPVQYGLEHPVEKTTQKRTDEMMVGLKTGDGPRVILP